MEILRNLTRRKLRNALTVAGIMIGVLALTTMGAMAEKFNLLFDGGERFFSGHVVVNDPSLSGFGPGLHHVDRPELRPDGRRVEELGGHLPPGQEPRPVEVADRDLGGATLGDVKQRSEVLAGVELIIAVDDQAVAEVRQLVEEPALEVRAARPPQHHRQIGHQQRRHDAGQVLGNLAMRVQQHLLVGDQARPDHVGEGADGGLQLRGMAILLRQQDQGPGGVMDRHALERVRDAVFLLAGPRHRDQVERARPGLRRGVFGRLPAQRTIREQPPAKLGQLLLDRPHVEELADDPGVVGDRPDAHGRRQRRPSRSIRASAASGPQVPAA